MNLLHSLPHEVAGSTIGRGIVVRVDEDRATVVIGEDNALEMECEVLHPDDGRPLRLAAGDAVLVWRATEDGRYGVVLGRLGQSHAPQSQSTELPESLDAPNELVLEAKRSLTLRVGDGSITIRADGRILIKGKDLVSHATRMNRIKGGAVQIN